MSELKKVLIIQTAFLGDLILTLPLVQAVKRDLPGESQVDIIVIPETCEVLRHNPLINETIVFDKRNSGPGELLKLGRRLKANRYDVLLSPHRSARSALLSSLASPHKSISFDRSSLSFLYSETVKYRSDIHEIQRNLSLLEPLGIGGNRIIRPELFVGNEEKSNIDELLKKNNLEHERYVALAHGSVWFTKKFPVEKVIRLVESLVNQGISVILTGGKRDVIAGETICTSVRSDRLLDLTGKLRVLESAELIARAEVLITNDSAPLHIGNSVETPVYAIFGSTITGFGFFPYGPDDRVYEINGLSCRPCGIHGKNACPTGTFDCMMKIDETAVARDVIQLFRKT